MKKLLFPIRVLLLIQIIPGTMLAQESEVLIPQIEGEWWQIAGNPDLGELTGENQQPVDFGIWQAADGTWQVWSCIRNTRCAPQSHYTQRLFHGWEGEQLSDEHWKPLGITMRADTTLGETMGGMQAPYVFIEEDVYHMFYGDYERICLARSRDGKQFSRVLNKQGQPDLFIAMPDALYRGHTRDPMVIRKGNTYYCYYTANTTLKNPDGAAYCRTSLDMRNWSESVMVSHTPPHPDNSPKYSDECPHVLYMKDINLFYLFVTQRYGQDSQTTVYASPNLMYFGIDDDQYKVCTLPVAAPEIIHHKGEWYIASLMPGLNGIHMANLKWIPKDH